MAAVLTALRDGGGWALLVLSLAAFIFARSRGYLVTSGEVEREIARAEKSSDKVIELYGKQLELAAAANSKKDETIQKQAEQIERLLAHSAVSAHALTEIVEEAKRRGMATSA